MFEKHLWKSDILSKDAGHRHGRFDMTVCSSQIRVDINAVFFSCFSIFWGIQRSERNLRKFGDLRRFKEILYLKSDAFFKFFIFSLNNLSVIDNSAWRLFQESCSTNWPHIYQISHKTLDVLLPTHQLIHLILPRNINGIDFYLETSKRDILKWKIP